MRATDPKTGRVAKSASLPKDMPPGRSPIRRADALSVSTFQRLFSSATLSSIVARIFFSVSSSGAIASERMSIAIFASGAIVLTEVPPLTVPTVNVVFGDAGVRTSAILAMARPIAWRPPTPWRAPGSCLPETESQVPAIDPQCHARGKPHQIVDVWQRRRFIEIVHTPDEAPFAIAPGSEVFDVKVTNRRQTR